jgi:hypothetical protein
MEVKKNVVAAISAALQLYMQAEQQPPVVFEERLEAPRPGSPFNAWAMSGRQSAMDMRRLWQMRLVR